MSKYIIVDDEYKVYHSSILSGRLVVKCKRGEISIFRLRDMKGMNRDGTWSDIQPVHNLFGEQ